MKSIPALMLVLAMLVPSAQASSPEIAQIVRERDATLSQIVTALEERYQSGSVNMSAVFAARLALATFRRDVAPNPQEKRAQQEAIVALWEKQLANEKAREKAGIADPIEVLTVTAELLAAKQTLLEIAEKR